MSDYSDTDLRVIRFLRGGVKTTAALGRECFRLPGGRINSGLRPAAAHLARMEERGLVRRARSGLPTTWCLTEQVTETGQDLFQDVPSQKCQVPKRRQ